MRHGRSRLNRLHRFSGQKEAPLIPEGKESAKKAGRFFKKNNVVFDCVFSSPLLRAYKTASIICKETEFNPKKIIIDKRLTEQDFGSWEGLTREEIEKKNPGQVDAWESDYFHVTPPRGENYADIEMRVGSFARELQKQEANTVLVVTHANTMRLLVKRLAKLDREKTSRLSVSHNVIYRVRSNGKKPSLKVFFL